jgi:ABC-type bacteriocin/lantibiotic exporter with double-glycine peptidase domain
MSNNIEIFKQSRGYCGPASLKIILSFYGIRRSEKYLARLTKADRKYGSDEFNIINAARKLGFDGYIKQNSSIEEVKNLIDRGYSIIVDWFLPYVGGHYSVVAGFKKDNIVIADPHYGKIKNYNIDWFNGRWFEIDKGKLILREIIVLKKD